MKLDRGIKVDIGNINSMVYGGSFKDFDPRSGLIGVKMARELNLPCDISIPTKDYSVPLEDVMQDGIRKAINCMAEGKRLYVGCMGGIGRTGLFMGCLVKVLNDTRVAHDPDATTLTLDPVKHVRRDYISHAIETKEQQEYIRAFNTDELVVHLMIKSGLFTPAPITATVAPSPTVQLSLFETVKGYIGRLFS